jgi:hypothetical protein
VSNNENNPDALHLLLDKEDVDVLLEGEYALLTDERSRRSSEQTEYLKFVLIGIVTQFALVIFELINADTPLFEKFDAEMISLGLTMVSCGVVLLTTIIFFFWLDHALTISAIDHFFRKKEKVFGVRGWHAFRDHYSRNTHFCVGPVKVNLMEMKIQMFKLAIFASFLTPPLLFVVLASISMDVGEYSDTLAMVNYTLFGLFASFIVGGLAMWQFSARSLYFKSKTVGQGR